MSEIHPSSEGYEQLKQFCILIGEGRVEPKEDKVHYMLLCHPTIENELLLVHSDWPDRQIFIREFPEGFGAGSLEDYPLVHTIYVRGMPIFPFVVDIHHHEKETTYHYTQSMGTASINKIPLAQYNRLKLLFDDRNPTPWREREDPAHLLIAPVNPSDG